MKIALVTDSTADIPPEQLLQHQISVVPNLVIIDGKSYQDGIDITRQEYYQRLPGIKKPPTTATGSIGTYQAIYKSILSQGADYIISIHAASKLSGIFNAASTAAQAFDNLVSIIDSGQLSLGVGFQVLAAAEAIASGSTLEDVISLIKDVQQRVHVIAMLDTLEYVRRSGRVSWARAQIGNLLRVKPFLSVKDGNVLRFGDARTRQKGIHRLKQFLSEIGPIERLAILHTNAEKDAHKFLDDMHPDLDSLPFIVNVTTVIGTHVGPNGLGFAAVEKT